MKSLKLIIVLTILFLSTGSLFAQQKNPQTVIIQLYGESKGMELNTSLIVTTPDATSYEVPMEVRTIKNKKESTIKNSVILQKEIDKWKKDGFIVNAVSNNFEALIIIMSKD